MGNACPTCGKMLNPGQIFCPGCGAKVGAPAPSYTPSVSEPDEQPKKKGKKGIIIAAIAAVVVVAILLFSCVFGIAIVGCAGSSGGIGNSGPDLQGMYYTYCSSTWAEVGSDGSYLSIDTNPYDWDDDGLAYPEAWTAVKSINAALGLPESLSNDMGETRGADGKQTRTYDDLTVSWTYHPDEGLEVTYRKN